MWPRFVRIAVRGNPSCQGRVDQSSGGCSFSLSGAPFCSQRSTGWGDDKTEGHTLQLKAPDLGWTARPGAAPWARNGGKRPRASSGASVGTAKPRYRFKALKVPCEASMTANRYTGPGMTIGNMRSHGVRSIEVTCGCGHSALVDADQLDDLTELSGLRARLRCSACNCRPIDVRPNWREHSAPGRVVRLLS
jgi:hypothetical protein